MSGTLRTPAWTPPPAVVAEPWPDSPATALAAWFDEVLRTRMQGLPFLNPRLAVGVVGMTRVDGDWLGILITPWSLQLVLLPGGGTLWQDLSAGCRRPVALPVGVLDFIADAGERELPAYQYCPLASSVEGFSDMTSARRFASEALAAVLTPAPAPAEPVPGQAVNQARRGLLGLRARERAVR